MTEQQPPEVIAEPTDETPMLVKIDHDITLGEMRALAARFAPPAFPATPAPIAACPECLGDCQQEGTDGWFCAACQQTWTFQQVAYFEGDRDD